MDRQNFLQMPSVLTGAKQPPKQEPVKILTEHCNSAIAPVSERGKYLLGAPYYDLLFPYLGRNYLMRLSEEFCKDVKECHGIWLPHFLVDVVARDLFNKPTVAEPQKDIWRY